VVGVLEVSRYITIDPDEWSLCVQVANARQVSSIKKGGRDTLSKKDGWLEEFTPHIIGCVGELAVAKALGVSWTGSVDTFRSVPDLEGGVQVRHRKNPTWDLIVRSNDKDHETFILSRGMPPGAIEVVGWISGKEAKNPEWLKDYGNFNKPAYFVPTWALKEIK